MIEDSVLDNLNSFSSCASAQQFRCYTCNSQDNEDCLKFGTDEGECGHVVAGVGQADFRCVSIHGANHTVHKHIGVRRCGVKGDCNFYVTPDGAYQWDNVIYPDTHCHECEGDLCNNQVFV